MAEILYCIWLSIKRLKVHVWGGRQDIQGLVLIKELALVDPRDNLKVTSQRLRGLPALRADIAM